MHHGGANPDGPHALMHHCGANPDGPHALMHHGGANPDGWCHAALTLAAEALAAARLAAAWHAHPAGCLVRPDPVSTLRPRCVA